MVNVHEQRSQLSILFYFKYYMHVKPAKYFQYPKDGSSFLTHSRIRLPLWYNGATERKREVCFFHKKLRSSVKNFAPEDVAKLTKFFVLLAWQVFSRISSNSLSIVHHQIRPVGYSRSECCFVLLCWNLFTGTLLWFDL